MDIKNKKLSFIESWRKDKDLLYDISTKFDNYKGKLEKLEKSSPNKRNVSLLVDISDRLKIDFSFYKKYQGLERKKSGKSGGAKIIDEIYSRNIKDIKELKPKIETLDTMVKKLACSYEKMLSKSFDKQSKMLLDADNIKDLQKERNQLTDVAGLYDRVDKNVLKNKNKKINRWINFADDLDHIAPGFFEILQLYNGMKFEEKSEFEKFISKTKVIGKNYKRAVKKNKPFGFRKSIYNCSLELNKIKGIKKNIDYVLGHYDELDNLKNSLLNKIKMKGSYEKELDKIGPSSLNDLKKLREIKDYDSEDDILPKNDFVRHIFRNLNSDYRDKAKVFSQSVNNKLRDVKESLSKEYDKLRRGKQEKPKELDEIRDYVTVLSDKNNQLNNLDERFCALGYNDFSSRIDDLKKDIISLFDYCVDSIEKEYQNNPDSFISIYQKLKSIGGESSKIEKILEEKIKQKKKDRLKAQYDTKFNNLKERLDNGHKQEVSEYENRILSLKTELKKKKESELYIKKQKIKKAILNIPMEKPSTKMRYDNIKYSILNRDIESKPYTQKQRKCLLAY